MCILRKTKEGDVEEIFSVLYECRQEIPINLDTDAHQKALKKIISDLHLKGTSLVVTNTAGKIVGVALTETYDDSPPKSQEACLSIKYLAVKCTYRKKGVFTSILTALKTSNNALSAHVYGCNQGNMKQILIKNGFVEKGTSNSDNLKCIVETKEIS